jgi:nucleoid DNA-binding protein
MIIVPKEIYEKVAKEHTFDKDLVESVGNSVFQELRNSLNYPTELAYEVPKLGIFSLRFMRFERYYKNFVNLLNKENEKAKQQLENNPEYFKNNTTLFDKIQDYRIKKNEVRNARYNTIKSREDNIEEHKEIPPGMD